MGEGGPILTVHGAGRGFDQGTANRSRAIATSVIVGSAIIFPTGGHALVGHYADAMREITAFLDAVSKRQPRR